MCWATGSVVPLFHRQLAAGEPLTVTRPEPTRHFNTVRQAVELVLWASALGVDAPSAEAGRIDVLDMGEPVKIMDLAPQIIRLAALRPDKDIKIEVAGLRPGKKLREELFHEAEPQIETGHSGLRLAAPHTAKLELLGRSLGELAEFCAGERGEAAADRLAEFEAAWAPSTPRPQPVGAGSGERSSRCSLFPGDPPLALYDKRHREPASLSAQDHQDLGALPQRPSRLEVAVPGNAEHREGVESRTEGMATRSQSIRYTVRRPPDTKQITKQARQEHTQTI